MRRRTTRIGSRRATIYTIILIVMLFIGYLRDEIAPRLQQAFDKIEQTEKTKQIEEAESTEKAEATKDTATPTAERNTAPATKSIAMPELPQMQHSDENYVTTHHSGSVRNYTVCYSSRHRSPLWVAAPMHRCYEGETKRKDNYTFDPTLPVNIQTRLNRSYGDYTRGHMLGSAERNVSRELNDQTFYVTNIAPQLREGFNQMGGAWNNLESLVDKQVCADTLYLVTGAIYEPYTDSNGEQIPARTTINKNDEQEVGVPTAYYKVMLRTKSGTTGRSVAECATEELKCVAFIVGHRSAKGRKPSVEDMLSVRELERMTGIDFFASVPHAPETEANPEDWGL